MYAQQQQQQQQQHHGSKGLLTDATGCRSSSCVSRHWTLQLARSISTVGIKEIVGQGGQKHAPVSGHRLQSR